MSRAAWERFRFPDRVVAFHAPAGCRKVRRGDETRGAGVVVPSPPSGTRQLTGGVAPRGGTMRAGSSAKRPSVMATDAAARRIGAARERVLRDALRASPAVDTQRPSDIVDSAKKVDISRGLRVSYQSCNVPPRTALIRLTETAAAARRAPAAALRPSSETSRAAGSPEGASEDREERCPERSPDGASPGGMSLAGLVQRGATPRGSGGRAGRGRHERVRFGVGQAGIRPGRDAPHLLDGRLRGRAGCRA